ncbi:MAG TPA: hypothetical protein DDZ80_27935 [Cyanobacteria bacterium UBA8803]|nr:hypothetical protein [Cyanobacteria bacterium UBA8803]
MPSLTPQTIQRVREGLAAARDRTVSQTIQNTLDDLVAIAEGGCARRVSGELRRSILRSLVRTLFRVKVEYLERIPQVPALLVANHLNHIDPFLVLSEMPAHPYYGNW